jgi:hypothetical protein
MLERATVAYVELADLRSTLLDTLEQFCLTYEDGDRDQAWHDADSAVDRLMADETMLTHEDVSNVLAELPIYFGEYVIEVDIRTTRSLLEERSLSEVSRMRQMMDEYGADIELVLDVLNED